MNNFCYPLLAVGWFMFLSATNVEKTVATVGNVCKNDTDCTGQNEFCRIPTDFSPPCAKGLCACKGCYMLNGTDCVKISYVKSLGDACTRKSYEIIVVPNAECDSVALKVQCVQGYVQNGTDCTLRTSCDANTDCPLGMVCSHDKTCACNDASPNPASACAHRQYGDSCTEDKNCGSSNFAAWKDSYATSQNAKCTNGVCACSLKESMPTMMGYINPLTLTFDNKTVCLDRSVPVNVANGTVCQLKPTLGANQTTSFSVCDYKSFCYQCPEDVPAFGADAGICRTPHVGTMFDLVCPEKPTVKSAAGLTTASSNGDTATTKDPKSGSPPVISSISYCLAVVAVTLMMTLS